jgi:acetyl esterase/lipase
MRIVAGLPALAVCAALLAACGGSTTETQTPSSTSSPVVERAYGSGPGQVWIFKPRKGRPRALVVFFHGLGDQRETTHYHHRPWLRHLAAEGNMVFYPRFEQYPGAPGALKNAISGIRTAMDKAALTKPLPVVVIGYSRGGGLGFDYTAIAPVIGPTPAAVLEVFPAMQDPKLDLRGIHPGTSFVFLVGEEDEVVGSAGAQILIRQLAAVKYPKRWVKTELVRSHGSFTADHLSVLETTPGAKAAFWKRADRLIADVRSGKA